MCRRAVIAVLCGVTLGGCAPLPATTALQKKQRMVYVLPGIEGPSRINRNIVRGLLDGGIEGAVEIFDWSTTAGPFAWYVHLTDIRRNRVEASRLARRILRVQREFPDRPIFLVAHSGGAGIALSAVEMLPETTGVDGVILLAAAVSP
ncbi:MAG: hypothetical protein IID39_05755, partial [Planctomycetes bacterium]|nr:hypothetical protein [Planctomycetota bacterium]